MEANPTIFGDFREKSKTKQSSISNEEMVNNLENIETIIDQIALRLRGIPTGGTAASDYHKTAMGALELIFYPDLTCPQIEQEIHEGRKRIDFTFDNSALSGFFYNLHKIYNTAAQYIIIECKNYSRDVANPELDQISSRFGVQRGQFGIIVCRSIEDLDLFLARCKDTYTDGRGTVIPLTDEDIIRLLEEKKNGNNRAWETLLTDRRRTVTI